MFEVAYGVTERAPVLGQRYVAFAVHPRNNARCIVSAVAVAHAEGDRSVLDAVREDISIDDCCAVLHRYWVTTISAGDEDGDDDALVHAVAGAICLAAGKQLGGAGHSRSWEDRA
jgi:hypothetical protein